MALALMTETRVVIAGGECGLQPAGEHAAGARNGMTIAASGPPPFDDADRAVAAKFQATLSDEDIEASYRRGRAADAADVPLCDQVVRWTPNRADDGLHGRGRRELGGADGAGARRHLRDRHTRTFLELTAQGSCRRHTRGWCMWRR